MDYLGFVLVVEKIFDGRMMADIRKNASNFLKGSVLYQDKTPDISIPAHRNESYISEGCLHNQKRTNTERDQKSLCRKILPC